MTIPNDRWDYIVIGSGFGGSVAALRLAEKGYRILVIEKGKRYRPADYARSNWNFRRYFWMPRIGFYGIQCLTLLKHVFILHGAGVGGGSLVYANNLLTPSDEVFAKPEWGDSGWKERLEPHYQTAKRMLGATPSRNIGAADEKLAEIGRELTGQDTFHLNDVGVFFGESGETVPDPYFDGRGPERTGCTFCGACMVGCRDGAKNTLDKNYLHLAEQLGVSILAETEVEQVIPRQGYYRLLARKTTGIRRPRSAYESKGVIFAGGVMGTVKLLLRCKADGLLPKLSDQLGNTIRTNSETLTAVKSRDTKVNLSNHLAITSGIYPDADTHIEIVRYPRRSDAMSLLTSTLIGGGGRIPRPLRFLAALFRKPLKFFEAFWPFNWAQRTSILLVMQTVENYMRFTFKRRWWRLGGRSMNSAIVPGVPRVPAYIPVADEVTRRLAEKMDGRAYSMLPEVMFDVSSTAHILGGCNMAASPREGVCDFQGKVHGYDNLHIMDGSVIPANLGVNPSLTITALAEYLVGTIPAKDPAGT